MSALPVPHEDPAALRQQLIAASAKIRRGQIWECEDGDAVFGARHGIGGHLVRVFSRSQMLAVAPGGSVSAVTYVMRRRSPLVRRHEGSVRFTAGPDGDLVPAPGERGGSLRSYRDTRRLHRMGLGTAGPAELAAVIRQVRAASLTGDVRN